MALNLLQTVFTAGKVRKSLHVTEMKTAIYTIKIIFTGLPKKVTLYSVICLLYTHLFLGLYPSYVTATTKMPKATSEKFSRAHQPAAKKKDTQGSSSMTNPIFNTARFGQHILKNPATAQK